MKLIEQDPIWPEFAGPDWELTIMTVPVTDLEHRKQNRAIARWTLIHTDGHVLVGFLKRHFRLGWWATLGSKLFPKRAWSPGLQEWHHLQWAKQNDLPVPRPLAAGELRAGARLQSFLVVEELKELLPLHELIPLALQQLKPLEFEQFKHKLLSQLAELCAKLHQKNHYHKDLYFCHFYSPTPLKNQPGQMVMIDLHRLGRHRLLGTWYLLKDLGQLFYSANVEGVTKQDHLRLWIAYSQRRWPGIKVSKGLFLWLIQLRAKRYQRHHDRKIQRLVAAKV